MPPEIIKPNIYVKNKTLDVLVKLKGKIVNIEINSGYYKELHFRNASYLFSKYTEEVKVGDKHYIMSDFIQINFTRHLSKKYPLLGIYTLYDYKTKLNFIDNLKIYEYNIDKIFDECYNKHNKKFNFIALLDSNEEELEKICKGDNMMEEIERQISELNKDEEFTEFMSREEDVERVTNTLLYHAKEDGLNEGLQKGITKEKKETAKKMLKDNLNIETISKYTGLSIEEIKKLQ